MPPGKFCKITHKHTHFCAFWKQVLDNTVYIFLFLGSEGGGHGPVASPLRTLVLINDYKFPGACPRENFAKLHINIRIFVHSGSKFQTILFLYFFIFRV